MKTFPPPTSIDDVAYHVTAVHVDFTAAHGEEGTWSALGRTPEEAQASMDRHLKVFPKDYKEIRPPARCAVVESDFGLVWKITGVRSSSDDDNPNLGATPMPSPENVELILGPACSPEEAKRRVERGKTLRTEMMRPKISKTGL